MRTSALTAFGLTAFLLSLAHPAAAQSPTPWDRCISRDARRPSGFRPARP